MPCRPPRCAACARCRAARAAQSAGTGRCVTLSSPSNILDGFTIRNGINAPVTFEFDRNNSITTGNVRIALSNTATQNDIVNAIVAAVRGVPSLGLAPVNSGSGRVWLGGTVNHSVTVTQSSLTLSGQPGAQIAGAIPVPFVPGTTNTTPAVPLMCWKVWASIFL